MSNGPMEVISPFVLRAIACDMEEMQSPQAWADRCRAAAAEIERLRAALKTARRDALEEAARREMPPEFLDWMKRQMPKNTIIGNPEWWAGRIWRAAIRALKGEGDE